MCAMSSPGLETAIDIPRSALRFALLQRPMLQRFTGMSRRFKLPASLVLRANVMFRRQAISTSYSRMIHDDFEMIRPHLPPTVENMLDIGCGIAGLDVILYQHYRSNPGLKITLLDRTDPRTLPRYGFLERTEFYNALDVSKGVLLHNRVPARVFETLDAVGGRFPEGPLDLVVSIASWGFHYPVSTYLERVHAALAPGARVILDVRRGHGQLEELSNRFAEVEPIATVWNDKATRVWATR